MQIEKLLGTDPLLARTSKKNPDSGNPGSRIFIFKKVCLFFRSATEKQKKRVEKPAFLMVLTAINEKNRFCRRFFYKKNHKKAEKPRN